jgi:hypothetical protein
MGGWTGTAQAETTAPARLFHGKPGPWGELQYTRIAIALPDEYIETDTTHTFDTGTWVFPGFSRAHLKDLFTRAALTDAQREYILHQAKWEEGPGAVVVYPNVEFILSISRPARQAIYTILGSFAENPAQQNVFMFREEALEDQFYRSGVSSETVERFKKLLYRRGNLLMFADAGPFNSSLPTADEKRAFHRAISRKTALLMKLEITPETDIEALLKYWDFTGRPKELRPLLESLGRIPEGSKIDIAHVLPAFARKRLYTFPRPNDTNQVDHNCHWTAFNFFNDTPDEKFCNVAAIQQAVATEYDVVSGDLVFGDIAVLFDAQGNAVHSMVWVADGVVFTKNGSGHNEPWLLMPQSDVIDYYKATAAPGAQFGQQSFRRKHKPGA